MSTRVYVRPGMLAVLLLFVACDYFDPFTGFADDDLSQYRTPSGVSGTNTLIPNAAPRQAYLHAGASDWYNFSATYGVTYTIQTTGSLDTWMALYAPDSVTQLVYDDDDGVGTNALISWTCASSGTYHVMVRGYSASTYGQYYISVTSY